MKVIIATIAIGGWYPLGLARMIQKFKEVSPGFDLMAWVNTLPPGAPADVIVDGYDYTAYCAKPFALHECARLGADIGILLDASFWPIRPIHPLVEHIQQHQNYFCANGFNTGEWCGDHALRRLGIKREESFSIPEISSYCVGLNFGNQECRKLLAQWCRLAADRITFPGRHTNINAVAPIGNRNPGNVSPDPRVRGHRHDQTALSVLAWKAGMDYLVERPKLTTYFGKETSETVLVNWGQIL